MLARGLPSSRHHICTHYGKKGEGTAKVASALLLGNQNLSQKLPKPTSYTSLDITERSRKANISLPSHIGGRQGRGRLGVVGSGLSQILVSALGTIMYLTCHPLVDTSVSNYSFL